MEENSVLLKDLLPVMKEVLSQGGEFRVHPQGVSMLPYLREGRDTVILSAFSAPPRRGDLLLYTRPSGTLVLHRVVKVDKDGSLWMRGDNQYFTEKGIKPEQVLATVKRVLRNGKEVGVNALPSRLYRARRTATYPARRVWRAVARRAKNLFGRGRNV